MPVAAPQTPTAVPSDTGIPGLARRRVWAAPDVVSHSLIVLTLPRLYLAPPGPPPKPELVAALESAVDAEAALGPLATAIDLASVQRVKLDLTTNTLTVEYRVGGSQAGGRVRAAVRFAAAETADTVFGKLWRRLGDGCVLQPTAPDPWDVARAPVAFMAALLAGTGVLALGLNAAADVALADRWPVARLLPDWQPVCGLAGAAVAAAQVWLYRRLTRPPERLELVRESN